MPEFGKVCIIGVGLIGGSIGRAVRERGLAECIVGVGRSESRLAEAVEVDAVDEGTTDLGRGVSEADVVVVCTPVAEIAAGAVSAARLGPDGMLVTDAGSTKHAIVADVEADPRGRTAFVGAHPIAGSHRNGVAHATPDLFAGRVCVLTPTVNTPPEQLARARAFWRGIGCRLVEIDPERHDAALALTSHLPHAVAAALAASVPTEALELAAGAYRDGTRVAAADAALWSAIFLANRLPLLQALGRFEQEIVAFKTALAMNDETAIQSWWNAARARREVFEARHKNPAVEH